MWLQGGLVAELSEVLRKVCSSGGAPCCLAVAATGFKFAHLNREYLFYEATGARTASGF